MAPQSRQIETSDGRRLRLEIAGDLRRAEGIGEVHEWLAQYL